MKHHINSTKDQNTRKTLTDTHTLIQTLNTDADLTAIQTRNDRTTQYSK